MDYNTQMDNRIAMMKNLSTESLLRIRENLAQYNPDAGWNDFKCLKMDDLWTDCDFELAVRGIK